MEIIKNAILIINEDTDNAIISNIKQNYLQKGVSIVYETIMDCNYDYGSISAEIFLNSYNADFFLFI